MLEAYGLYTHIRSNRIKTGLALVTFPALLPSIIFGGMFGISLANGYPVDHSLNVGVAYAMLIGFVVVPLFVLWVPIGYLMNQWIIDRATGARGVTRKEQGRIWNLLENLCISRGIVMPTLRIIETPELNAFASGMSNKSYSVTLTRGLIDCLDDQELECVIAHELTHIRNRDVQLLIVTTIVAGVAPLACDLVLAAWMIFLRVVYSPFRALQRIPIPGMQLLALVEPLQHLTAFIVAVIVRSISAVFSLMLSMFISRRREFMADAGAIELTKNPEALISALRKVSGNSDVPTALPAVRQMYFDNPRIFGIAGLFSTHPSIESRVEAIVRYAQQYGHKAAAPAHERIAPAQTMPPAPIIGRRFAADYEQFLRRRIEGSGTVDSEARRQLYKRVGEVLTTQLQQADPPLSDQEWGLESDAFRAAVQRIEAAIGKVRPSPSRLRRDEAQRPN